MLYYSCAVLLRAFVCTYDVDHTYRDFWSVLTSLPLELQKKFLLFTTGSDRIPVGGMGEMYFKVPHP